MAIRRSRKHVRVKLLYEDGDACHICGLQMSAEVGTNHPLSITQDHLVPFSQDGPDKAHNIKLAHRFCNHYRDDQAIDEAMREHCRSKISELLGCGLGRGCLAG